MDWSELGKAMLAAVVDFLVLAVPIAAALGVRRVYRAIRRRRVTKAGRAEGN